MRPHKLSGVAYLAAYMLRNGERVADFFHKDKESLVGPSIRISRATLTDSLAEEAYRPALYADCADADVELARSIEASRSAYFSRPGELAAVVHGIAATTHAAMDAGSSPA